MRSRPHIPSPGGPCLDRTGVTVAEMRSKPAANTARTRWLGASARGAASRGAAPRMLGVEQLGKPRQSGPGRNAWPPQSIA